MNDPALERLHRQETREIPDTVWGKASWECCEVSDAVPEPEGNRQVEAEKLSPKLKTAIQSLVSMEKQPDFRKISAIQSLRLSAA